jgi:predicted phosphohydrolase
VDQNGAHAHEGVDAQTLEAKLSTAVMPPTRDLRTETTRRRVGTRLAWMTDLHLDFVDETERAALAAEVVAARADGVVVTGDIATAADVLETIDELAQAVHVPLWFVLGNHDFYGGSIADVRARAAASTSLGGPPWLEAAAAVRLGPGTALVGVDGWGDARLGDFAGSRVVLNDFLRIDELTGVHRAVLRERLAALGDAAAAVLRPALQAALAWADHVVVATHVPPFRDGCSHQAAISADDWLPFFACGAVGDVIGDAAAAHPHVQFTVLCGHTHGAGEARILDNLLVLTGGAEYGEPKVQGILVV